MKAKVKLEIVVEQEREFIIPDAVQQYEDKRPGFIRDVIEEMILEEGENIKIIDIEIVKE